MQEVTYIRKDSKEAVHNDDSQGGSRRSSRSSHKHSVYYETLNHILFGTDKKEVIDAVYDFNESIRRAKLQYKPLENEIVAMIKGEHKDRKDKEDNLMELVIPNILTAYEVSYLEGLHDLVTHLLITVLGRLQDTFSKNFNEKIHKILLDFWTRVDSTHLEDYLKTFKLYNKVNFKDMVPIIDNLIKDRFFEDAANYIAFLNLHQHFNIETLIVQLANGKYITALSSLVAKNVEWQKKAIKELMFNKQSPQAADLVKKFKLDPKQFPHLIETLEKTSLRYHARQVSWFALEEKFYDSPHVLAYFVEDEISKEKFDVALSIIVRHKLNEKKDLLRKDTMNKIDPYLQKPPVKPFNYLENPLFVADAFMPTEELLKEAARGTYCHLVDFGLDMEKDIIFIDDPQSKVFDLAIQDLLSSDAVGLDSEFKFNLSKFDFQPTALLQLANRKKIYLIDALTLIDSPKYNDFITELLASPTVQKIGHTLSADLHKLKVTRDNEQPLIVVNEMDIAKIYQKLYPEAKKYGLATICEHYIKKPMSKYDQVSNWRQRPLRKAQMHYAGMDAFMVIILLDKLKEEIIARGGNVQQFLEEMEAQEKERKESRAKGKPRGKQWDDSPTEEVKQNEELPDDATEANGQSQESRPKQAKRTYQRKSGPKKEKIPEDKEKEQPNDSQELKEKPKRTSRPKVQKGENKDKFDGNADHESMGSKIFVKEYRPKKKRDSQNGEIQETEKKE